jgi:Family of unknown function (DUF6526)
MSQTFENHTRLVPAWHFVAAPILLLNFGFAISQIVKVQSFATVVELLLSIALLIVWAFSRVFALTVQDRVIRLEMRLRLASLLPAEMRSRIPEFTVAQLVSLRFASDEELPALARKVLDEKMNNRKAIKKLIKNWQPDELRA